MVHRYTKICHWYALDQESDAMVLEWKNGNDTQMHYVIGIHWIRKGNDAMVLEWKNGNGTQMH